MKKYFKRLYIILTIFLIFSFVSCVGLFSGKWATLSPDTTVRKSFENLQINTAFNYYITGSDSYPRSILGLNKVYTLNSNLWKKIEPTPEIFYFLVNNMRDRAATCCFQAVWGYSIMDDNSKQMGVWYSIDVPSLSIQITDNKEVIIYHPNDLLYKSYDDQMSDR
jgi:hypothetical protein